MKNRFESELNIVRKWSAVLESKRVGKVRNGLVEFDVVLESLG